MRGWRRQVGDSWGATLGAFAKKQAHDGGQAAQTRLAIDHPCSLQAHHTAAATGRLAECETNTGYPAGLHRMAIDFTCHHCRSRRSSETLKLWGVPVWIAGPSPLAS